MAKKSKRKQQRAARPLSAVSTQAATSKPAMKIGAVALASAGATLGGTTTPWVLPKPAPGVAPASASLAMDANTADLYAYAIGSYDSGIDGIRFMGYPYLAELLLLAEYRRMVGVLAQEMTRKWVKLTSTGDEDKSEKLKLLDVAMKKFRVQDVFREAAEHDSAFGVGHIYIDTGAGKDPAELLTELVAKPEKIGKGGLKRIKAVEALWCYPGSYDSTDPMRPDFYRPQTWYVMAKEIHHSRFLTLVSREVPDILKPSFMFGGVSLTQLAKPAVDNWLRTRQSVSDLLHSFTVWNLKTNMASVLEGGGSEGILARAQMFNQFRDNRGLMMTDMVSEELGNIAVPLGGLDKLLAQSQEQQSAVDGMPLIKLVGYTPSGLNSTGEGEMDAWRDRVRAQQVHLFNAPLKRVLDVIQLSEFGEVDETISFEWEPLKEINETERANVRKVEADTAAVLIQEGVISPEDERRRLAQSEDSAYHGLELNEAPGLPDDDTDPDLDDPAEKIAGQGEEGGETGINSGV